MLDERTILNIFDDIGESLAVQQYAKESIAHAVQQNQLDNARELLILGLQPGVVAKALKLPLETVEELAKSIVS